jgi:O-acetyl-ADP-ribose deacetylase (regulator of RNase III)
MVDRFAMTAERTWSATRVELVLGNITHQAVDAIVNAANTTLLGGGGVDGAIHAAGGPAILEECRRLGGCATGDAKATGAGRLRARWVVHAVGPVWSGGGRREDELLASAWRRSLEVAVELGARSVAFPSISTGAYRFPIDRAAAIALGTVKAFVEARPGALDLVRVVLFSATDLAAWSTALQSA